jgi:hypothetical protein
LTLVARSTFDGSPSFQVLDRKLKHKVCREAARQALELQPDCLLGLWIRGLALSGLGRNEEAIESLERTSPCRVPWYL